MNLQPLKSRMDIDGRGERTPRGGTGVPAGDAIGLSRRVATLFAGGCRGLEIPACPRRADASAAAAGLCRRTTGASGWLPGARSPGGRKRRAPSGTVGIPGALPGVSFAAQITAGLRSSNGDMNFTRGAGERKGLVGSCGEGGLARPLAESALAESARDADSARGDERSSSMYVSTGGAAGATQARLLGETMLATAMSFVQPRRMVVEAAASSGGAGALDARADNPMRRWMHRL